MANKSKNTIALLARYPTFQDWVMQKLTTAQLDAICQTPPGNLSFGANHPLNDEKFSAGIFRAYRSDVIWQIEYHFDSFDSYLTMRGHRETFDETYHLSVVWAIAFMVQEHPELMTASLTNDPPCA
jgi:hypothetical protein